MEAPGVVPPDPTPRLMRRYLALLLAGWTVLLALSCVWNIWAENEEMRLVTASRVQEGESRLGAEGRQTALSRLSEASSRHARLVIIAHLTIYLLGCGTLLWGGRYLIRQLAENERAKRALQEQEANSRRYLDMAGVMLLSLNPRGEITLINRKGCTILGVTEEEALGKNWFSEFIPSRLTKEVHGVFASLMQGNIQRREYHENPVLTRSGEERIIAFENVLLTDGSGKISGILSAGSDITERIRMERALQEREYLYRNLIETTAAVTWELDLATLRFTYVSPQVEKLSGFPADRWTDFDFWAERVHSDDPEYAINFCKYETARGLDHSFEYRMLDAQGKVI